MRDQCQMGVPTSKLLRKLHHSVEAKEGLRISQALMAERLGISTRTYLEYLRGANSPLGMRVLLDLLSMLDSETLTQLIDTWRSERWKETKLQTEIST